MAQCRTFTTGRVQPMRSPCLLIVALPPTGVLDLAKLMAQAQAVFPGIAWVDIHLKTDMGAFEAAIESLPQAAVTIDPASPPPWLTPV